MHKCVLCDVYPPICMPIHQKHSTQIIMVAVKEMATQHFGLFFFSFTTAETILSVTQSDCTV